MTNIQAIEYVSDCVPLYLPHSLYLKPIARMNISVALPINKTGKSISNLEIMEKLSATLKPDTFLTLKVCKSTVDFIRFEGELDNRSHLRAAISRMDGVSVRLSGFSESFRVRASETKDDFPTRHDWDSFFRDASHMDEMKSGERPDTIHITHMPIRWFCPRHSENDDDAKPSENIFRRIFEKFGRVRCVDIPICDPYRNKMNSEISGMKTFSFEQDVLFEGYVQFEEYVGFVRAMDEFRGMKLVKKFVDKTQAINIVVNFDKTKHLSDIQMQRRERVRKRILNKVRAEEEEMERQKKLEQDKLEQQRKKEEDLKLAELEKQREREAKRREKHLKKIQERGQVEISQKIRLEERKLMIAQRKLESIRILEQLFDRIRTKRSANLRRSSITKDNDNLRERLVDKYKAATEKLLKEQRQKVEDIKSKTPIMGLLKSKNGRGNADSTDDDEGHGRKNKSSKGNANNAPANLDAATGLDVLNPFKAVAALAGANATAPYSADIASEWMKSFSTIYSYVPPVFPNTAAAAAIYRSQGAPVYPGVSLNYRGYAPRIRGRGRGRGGRGRGGYDSSYSSYHAGSSYRKYGDQDADYDDSYRRASYSRSRSRSRHRRSRSRSRTRSKSKGRNRRSRTRSPSKRRSRSYTYTKSKGRRRGGRSYSRSRSKSKGRSRRSRSTQRTNKKLVSTRRSRSTSYSSSQRSHSHASSRSRSTRNRQRTRERRHTSSNRSTTRRTASRSRSRSTSINTRKRVVIETDELVRSAESIKRTIEKEMQQRMIEEEREIKANFNPRNRATMQKMQMVNAMDDSLPAENEHTPNESPLNGGELPEKNDDNSTVLEAVSCGI